MKAADALRLVAHRGYPRHYPENTLAGITAALQAGARHLEVDVQLSRDGVPVLFHDATLERTTGRPGMVMDLDFATLARICAGEPRRFGQRFRDQTIPPLQALTDLLGDWPAATVFVEIKTESLVRFGTARMVAAVLEAVQGLGTRAIPISYDLPAVERARHSGAARIGWVLTRPDAAARRAAAARRPDFLFCNHRKLEAEDAEPWPGPWHWVLYEITDPELALIWHDRGAEYIETMAIGEMLRHPRLQDHLQDHLHDHFQDPGYP